MTRKFYCDFCTKQFDSLLRKVDLTEHGMEHICHDCVGKLFQLVKEGYFKK